MLSSCSHVKYINAGFAQLKSDKCVFVKIENKTIGGPFSLSPEDVINHGAFVSMSTTSTKDVSFLFAQCCSSLYHRVC